MYHSDQSNLQRFLNRLTSRSVLADEEQRAVLGLPCEAAQIPVHQDFVALGDTISHVSLVVEGMVGRFDQNADGARQITAICVTGDMVDLPSVVQPRATSAFQAISVSTILRIRHADIRAATARYPALAEALWRDCMVDASILSQWVVNVGRRDGKSRIAHLLCEIATRLHASPAAGAFNFPFSVTQAHLAEATGLTTVHVNRVLKALREDGLVYVRRHEVDVLNWDGLVEAGDFDANYLQTDIRPEERLRIVRAN